MTNSEIKSWAKEKIKGNLWTILPAIVISGILTNLTIGNSATYSAEEGFQYSTSYTLGWLFYFVEIGLTYFMVKFITDQPKELKDIFHFASDFLKALGASILQGIFIALWSLLFIIPGIIKIFSYALVPMIMADEKYKTMGIMDILKKSQEMMNGHKMDYFLLNLSFIGWHILAAFTLFILEIWVAPYQKTAQTKFLYEVKSNYEGPEKREESKTEAGNAHFCPACGTKVDDGIAFCPNCGGKI